MPKQSLEWHKETLKNLEHSIERMEKNLAGVLRRVIDLKDEAALRRSQIKMAEATGKNGFDAEKYLVPQKHKPRER